MKELWDLFRTFARIGGLTFGGGYAMLPMLQAEVVDAKHWVTEQELLNYYAIGQCTPGIISVNTATFIGYRLRGVIGGIVATLGVIAPSVVILTVLAAFFQSFASLELVRHAFAGVRIAVAALMLEAIVKLWKSGVRDVVGIALFAIGFGLSAFGRVSPVALVALAIGLGLLANHSGLVRLASRRKGASEGEGKQ